MEDPDTDMSIYSTAQSRKSHFFGRGVTDALVRVGTFHLGIVRQIPLFVRLIVRLCRVNSPAHYITPTYPIPERVHGRIIQSGSHRIMSKDRIAQPGAVQVVRVHEAMRVWNTALHSCWSRQLYFAKTVDRKCSSRALSLLSTLITGESFPDKTKHLHIGTPTSE